MKKAIIAASFALASLSASAAGNLVTNGDFETGDLTGWTSVDTDSSGVLLDNAGNNSFVYYGGTVGHVGYISQQIATAVGGTYDFSFDVYNTTTTQTSFDASFDGNTVHFFTNESIPQWTHYVVHNLEASSALTTVQFGIRNDPDFIRLDNVSVMAVPEPETYGMLLAGLGLVGLIARRKQAA